MTLLASSLSFSSLPPLKCIFFTEFDPKIGPKIVHQIPEEIVTKERFHAISGLIIPKHEVMGKLIKINLPSIKIMGYPTALENQKYSRNTYIFNLCFVVSNVSHDDWLYEPLVKKMANYLVALELEKEYLFNEETKMNCLPDLMSKVYNGINSEGGCSIEISTLTTVHLKLSQSLHGKVGHSVPVYMVPVFTRTPSIQISDLNRLDVLSQKICPYIDGLRSVLEIGSLTQIDPDLVSRCVRNLSFYGHVKLVPLFEYRNNYVCNASLHSVFVHKKMQKECQEFVALRSLDDHAPLPQFSDIFRLYCALKHGLTLGDWCKRENPRESCVDEQKLVQFGLVKGFVDKLTGYPVFSGKDQLKTPFEAACDGGRSIEDLCLKYSMLPNELMHWFEGEEKFVILWK